MQIYFDEYQRPEPIRIYLATANNKILCALNGINEESFNITPNLNNLYDVTFDISRYINVDGQQIESQGYELISILMRLYIDGYGWFILEAPRVSNDGNTEIKSVTAHSCEYEMLQHTVKNVKINKGSTDSYEMLADDNVEEVDGVEFAKEQIKFYNPENPQLCLLSILMYAAGLYGWSIGYIDNIPKAYKYYDNGVLKETFVVLSDEVGSFDIVNQDLYSLLTQDVAKYFSCIFVFDFKNLTINAYRPENLGKDTNINIGFRNLQNSNDITVDDSNLITRYVVSGSDDLGIMYVNFGSNVIENIDYLLNEKYLSAELIEKYKLWQSDMENSRVDYIEYTRLYNEQQSVVSELHNRLPLDDCSTDWSTFDDGELLEAQANYEAQLRGYESFYVDGEGNFDQEALDTSVDAADYYQIKDVILPSIQIEMENRGLEPGQDPSDYIDSYKTQWELYGLDELQVKLDEYQNIVDVCVKGGYDTPYSSTSGHTEDYHTKMYEKYLDAQNQLNPDFIGSCRESFDIRQSEIDEANAILKEYNDARNEIVSLVNKETWSNGEYYFSEQDLADLSKLYIDGEYTNENMFLLNSDDAVTAIDEQLKLLDAAKNDLVTDSQPQYIYTTALDNFLAKYEYRDYASNLNIGDFIYLGIRDDYVVKLRVISMSYNPMLMDNNLQITFSNMIRSASSRDDFLYLLGGSTGGSRGTANSSSGNYVSNEGVSLTPGLIQKLVANGSFKNQINQMIENSMAINGNNIILGSGGGSGGGGYASITELNADMIKVVDIIGQNGFFEYLQAKLISTDKIIADSGSFKELDALVARIDNLLAGNVVAELGHLIKLTAENVAIDEAVIRDLIAAQITVSMLDAGEISADKFNIVSDDGGLNIVGNTMQFKDKNGNIRIQIGRDTNNDFTFTIYNADGNGVLIDDKGIHESAIADGLIINDMIANGTLGKEKLSFNIVEGDEDGNVDISKVIINGNGLDVEFQNIKNSVKDLDEIKTNISGVSSKVDAVEKNITNKVWQTDITTAINTYDGSTAKELRDRVTSTEQDITGLKSTVSDVQSVVKNKADGSTVTSLSEKVTSLEQDAESFKTTVSETYATNDNLKNYSTTTQMNSAITQKANSIISEVESKYATKDGVEEVRSTLSQNASEIDAKVNDNTGNISTLTIGLNNITQRVEDAEGDIGTLTTTANNILAEVSNARGDSSSLGVRLDGITSTVTSNYDTLSSSISQNAREISLRVSEKDLTGDYIVSKINLDSTTATIAAKHINLEGAVTISALSSELNNKINNISDIANSSATTISNWCAQNDTTYIDGAKIYTGSITASQIDVDDIFAQDINATGTITGAKFVGATGDFSGSITCDENVTIRDVKSGISGVMSIETKTISYGVFNVDLFNGEVYGTSSAKQAKCFTISNENALWVDSDVYGEYISASTLDADNSFITTGVFKDITASKISTYDCSVSNELIVGGVNIKEAINGKADKTIQAVTVSGVSESTYSTSVTTNTRAIPSLCLVILNEQVTLTLSSAVTAGTTINLGTISSYKPGANVAVTIWQNSTQARRYMGVLTNKGVIEMKSNMDMSAGTYYIYITATYIW